MLKQTYAPTGTNKNIYMRIGQDDSKEDVNNWAEF